MSVSASFVGQPLSSRDPSVRAPLSPSSFQPLALGRGVPAGKRANTHKRRGHGLGPQYQAKPASSKQAALFFPRHRAVTATKCFHARAGGGTGGLATRLQAAACWAWPLSGTWTNAGHSAHSHSSPLPGDETAFLCPSLGNVTVSSSIADNLERR